MVEAEDERRMNTQACDGKIGVDDLQLGMACLVRCDSRKEKKNVVHLIFISESAEEIRLTSGAKRSRVSGAACSFAFCLLCYCAFVAVER